MINVNEYQNGTVKSLGFESQGTRFTAGVVMPGEYLFPTETEEHIMVTVGVLEVRLPDQDWATVPAGASVVVPAQVEFGLRVKATASYICEYC
jgi:purine/pyrimidine-nucleoside phosphorylase